MTLNEYRAEWARQALDAFQDITQSDHEDSLSDLLCDLMHYADKWKIDFELELARARDNYFEELTDDF